MPTAVRFAIDEHTTQVRKGTEITYVSHLLAVSALVLEHGGDEDLAIAGLLHDAVEDAHDGDGPTMAAAHPRRSSVTESLTSSLGCSDTDVVPKPPWRERKERYLADLLDARRRAARVGVRQAAQRPLHRRRPTRARRRRSGRATSTPGPPTSAGTTRPCWRCSAAGSPTTRPAPAARASWSGRSASSPRWSTSPHSVTGRTNSGGRRRNDRAHRVAKATPARSSGACRRPS